MALEFLTGDETVNYQCHPGWRVECCQRSTPIPEGQSSEIGDGIRWLPTPDGGARCEKLGLDDHCTIWETRPLACRLFPLAGFVDDQGTLVGFYRPVPTLQCQDCQKGGPTRTIWDYCREQGIAV